MWRKLRIFLYILALIIAIPVKVLSFRLRNAVSLRKLSKMYSVQWQDLLSSSHELTPSFTLNTGQCFNWKLITPPDCEQPIWIGMVEKVPIAIREQATSTEFASLLPTEFNCNTVYVHLKDYFQLKYNLKELYGEWSKQCDRMAQITQCLPGVRVVQQDPWECLISFICSSNNNISRITQMLNKLRYYYGDYVCSVTCNDAGDIHVSSDHRTYSKFNDKESTFPDSAASSINGRPILPTGASSIKSSGDSNSSPTQQHHLFTFPTAEVLASAREEDLRALGMGYRAKYIIQTAKKVAARPEGGREWLLSLRNPDTTMLNHELSDKCNIVKVEAVQVSPAAAATVVKEEDSMKHRRAVQQILQSLDGVGPKVADCVALFSLDQSSIIPVDTHVWSIVNRDYVERFTASRAAATTDSKLLRSTSLTKPVYECVGSVFRSIFGDKAGWAHSVLFAAELPEFRKRLPEQLQREMKSFEEGERANKRLLKEQKSSGKKGSKLGSDDVVSVNGDDDDDNGSRDGGDAAVEEPKRAPKKRKT